MLENYTKKLIPIFYMDSTTNTTKIPMDQKVVVWDAVVLILYQRVDAWLRERGTWCKESSVDITQMIISSLK